MQNNIVLIFICCLISSFSLLFVQLHNNSSNDNITSIDPQKVINESCFHLNNETNEYWRLVWEDHFDGNELNLNEWSVENELGNCHGNNAAEQVSCNVASNIQLTSGILSLSVKHEPYQGHNYTGASIISKRSFPKGRYEIRAALPIGKQIHLCLYTVNQQEAYWHQNGEIDIICTTNKASMLDRGIYFANSSDPNNYGDESLDLEGGNYHDEFHLYGVEWNETDIKFFFDQLYSDSILLNETYGARPFHQLRFQNVVGRDDYKDSGLLSNFTALQWQCPVLLIDYVRVYEKIEDNFTTSKIEETMKQCTNNALTLNTNDTKLLIQGLCAKALEVKRVLIWSQISKSWKEIALITLAITILILVGCLIYIFKRNSQNEDLHSKQFFEFDPHQNSQNYYSTENYENIYDSPEYADLQYEHCEYVQAYENAHLRMESEC